MTLGPFMAHCEPDSAFHSRLNKDCLLSLTTKEYRRKCYCGSRTGNVSLVSPQRDNLAGHQTQDMHRKYTTPCLYAHTSTHRQGHLSLSKPLTETVDERCTGSTRSVWPLVL